ncbi:hypothetical protein [Rickettsiella endosymbiont of Rhagonycha lignosa]|uniref:hypothetical protein n=1 Tax=Rickettsiella endosymbiont of Rhagonycha lignosa TaxID=3077937 RepID=UPI00313C557F
MPRIKDIVLASLLKDTSNDSFLKQEEAINPTANKKIKMETLTPPELVKEFDIDFRSYFEVLIGEDRESLPKTIFFKTEHRKSIEANLVKKVQIQISEEHNYCKKYEKN